MNENEVVTESAPEVLTPATEIVKAARKAKKGGKKAAKAPKKGVAKKKASKAPAAKKAAKKAPKAKGTNRRGPGSPNKVVRRGDAKLGARIAKARHAKGFTGLALAKKVGCTQPAIANIEKGTVGVSEKLYAKIAKALGL